MGVIVLVSSQKGNKGTISTSNDHFAQRDQGESQDQHRFRREVLSQSLLKLFGLQKGPLLPLFRRLVNITAAFDVVVLCAVGDAHCKTRELPKTFFRSPPRALILNRISDTTLPGGNPPPPHSVRHQHLHQITGKQNLPA